MKPKTETSVRPNTSIILKNKLLGVLMILAVSSSQTIIDMPTFKIYMNFIYECIHEVLKVNLKPRFEKSWYLY